MGRCALGQSFLEGRLLRSTWDKCEAVRHFDVLSAIVRRVAVDPSFCHRTAGFDRDVTSNLFGRRRGSRGRRKTICVLLFQPRLTPRIGMRRIRFPELSGRRCFLCQPRAPSKFHCQAGRDDKERWVNSLLLLTLFETAVQEDISAGRLSPDESLPRQRCSRLTGKKTLTSSANGGRYRTERQRTVTVLFRFSARASLVCPFLSHVFGQSRPFVSSATGEGS